MELQFTAEVWRYPGPSAWHFVTLPAQCAEEIRAQTEGERRGFGSVRVTVSIGSSTWNTSVFPDSSSGSFVLPVKKTVRVAEDLEDGDPAQVVLQLI